MLRNGWPKWSGMGGRNQAGYPILDGIRIKQGRKREKPIDKRGYFLAIKKVLEIKDGQISRENIWRHFERYHNQINIENNKSEPMYISGYQISYYSDLTGNKKEDVLVQEYEDKKRVIKKGTFFKYITKIRPKRKK